MGALRGAVVSGVGLIALYNLVDTTKATQAGVTTLFSLPGELAHWLISPDVPLVPDLRGGSSSSSSSGSSSGSTTHTSSATTSGSSGSGSVIID